MKNKGILIFLVILIIGLVGYITYDKFFVDSKCEVKEVNNCPSCESNREEDNNTENKEEDVSIPNFSVNTMAGTFTFGNKCVIDLQDDGLFDYSCTEENITHDTIGNYIINDKKIILNVLYVRGSDAVLIKNDSTIILDIKDFSNIVDNTSTDNVKSFVKSGISKKLADNALKQGIFEEQDC